MRRQLIHHRTGKAALTSAGVLTQLKTSWHLHFCVDRECRQIYEDFRCEDISRNGRCHTCRNAPARPVWIRARDPHDCCWGNCAQVIDRDELTRYRLAGPGPWFQCRTCARCHGWPCNERKP